MTPQSDPRLGLDDTRQSQQDLHMTLQDPRPIAPAQLDKRNRSYLAWLYQATIKCYAIIIVWSSIRSCDALCTF